MTGPLPSATDIRSSSSTRILTTASVTVTCSPRDVVPALDAGAVALDLEEFRQRSQSLAGEDGERCVGAVVAVAARFALLDGAEEPVEPGVVLGELDAVAAERRQQVRLARLLAHHDGALVADALGRHVLVGREVLGERRGVDARLGGEGRGADIGRLARRRPVQKIVEGA